MITSKIDGRDIYFRNEQWFFSDNDEPILNYKYCCMDCEKPYKEFGLDIILPDWQWEAINPSGDGILCGSCIASRASNLIGGVRINAEIILGVRGIITDNVT